MFSEKYKSVRQKIFDNIYSADELVAIKEAFLKHECVCIDWSDTGKFCGSQYTKEEHEFNKNAFSEHKGVLGAAPEYIDFAYLLRQLCDGLQEMTVLPVCLHLPRDGKLFQKCLLIINTGDQEDFKRVIGRAAKERGIKRFFHTLPDDGKVYSKEVVATEDGWDLKNLRVAKLLIDGRDHYLVLRPRSLNRED